MNTELSSKLECALVSYLYLFGGTVAPELLLKEAALFDNAAWFTPNPVAVRAQLAQWLGADPNPFAGMTWYVGHSGVDMAALPRCVIACAQGGGDGSYAGYEDLPVEVLMTSAAGDMVMHGVRHRALRDILQQSQLRIMQAVLNAPTAGADTRAVQGFGLDALVYRGQVEGRDEKKAQHGVKINLEVGAHLEGMGLI